MENFINKVDKLSEGLQDRKSPPAAQGRGGDNFPNSYVVSHRGEEFRLFEDLIEGHVVIINFMSIESHDQYPVTEHMANIAKELKKDGVLGKDVLMLSITMDPRNDTAPRLKEFIKQFDVPEGWHFLASNEKEVMNVSDRLFKHNHHKDHSKMLRPARLVHYGNGKLWGAFAADTNPEDVVEKVSWIIPTEDPNYDKPIRGGPIAEKHIKRSKKEGA